MRKIKNRVLAMFLAIVFVLGAVFFFFSENVYSASLSSSADATSYTIQVKRSGVLVDIYSVSDLATSESVYINIDWELNEYVQAGDYFDLVVDLPPELLIQSTISPITLKDASGNAIATWEYNRVSKRIRCTFINDADNKVVTNGSFSLQGLTVYSSSGQSGTIGSLPVAPISVIIGPVKNPLPNNLLYKGHSNVGAQTAIKWNMAPNFSGVHELYNKTTPTPILNAILEDEIPEDQLVTDVTVSWAMYVPNMDPSGATAIPTVVQVTSSSLTSLFAQETSNSSSESYSSFKSRIVAATVPTIGIFDSQKVVINFGDLPGSIHISDFMTDARLRSVLASSVTSGKITQQESDFLYDIWNENNIYTNGYITTPAVYIETTIPESGRYTNSVSLSSGTTEIATANSTTNVTIPEGGVGTTTFGKIILTKENELGAKLAGAVFDLQKYDAATAQYVTVKTETTDATGELVFDKIPAGKYRVKEVTAPTGYDIDQITYSGWDGPDNNEGTITIPMSSTINITAVNVALPIDTSIITPAPSTTPPVLTATPPIASSPPQSTATPTMPPTASATPPILTVSPPVASATPPILTVSPPVASATPPVLTVSPPVASATPPVLTVSPPIASATPPVLTVSPPIASATPPVLTVSPPIASATPPVLTVSPPIASATPPVLTVSPPIASATPPVLTVSPPVASASPHPTIVPTQTPSPTSVPVIIVPTQAPIVIPIPTEKPSPQPTVSTATQSNALTAQSGSSDDNSPNGQDTSLNTENQTSNNVNNNDVGDYNTNNAIDIESEVNNEIVAPIHNEPEINDEMVAPIHNEPEINDEMVAPISTDYSSIAYVDDSNVAMPKTGNPLKIIGAIMMISTFAGAIAFKVYIEKNIVKK